VLKILGRKNSSNVQKVLWCCGELGVKFTREDYGGPFGKTKEAAYLALNPNALVPTIDDDGFILWESNSILRYLANKQGGSPLYPADPKRRADVERWMDWQLSTMGPAITPMFLQLYRTAPEKRDHAAVEASRLKTAEACGILDRQLAGKAFITGDAFTYADLALGIFAGYRWFNFPIERPELKNLRAWYDRLTERPAFKEHVMIGIT
jgi:glutathione S-transferase